MNTDRIRLETLTAGYSAVSRLQTTMNLDAPTDVGAIAATLHLLDQRVVKEKKLEDRLRTLQLACAHKWCKPKQLPYSQEMETQIRSVTAGLSEFRQALFVAIDRSQKIEPRRVPTPKPLIAPAKQMTSSQKKTSQPQGRFTPTKVRDDLDDLFIRLGRKYPQATGESLNRLALHAGFRILESLVRKEDRYPEPAEWNALIQEVREFLAETQMCDFEGTDWEAREVLRQRANVFADELIRERLTTLRRGKLLKSQKRLFQKPATPQPKPSIIEPAPNSARGSLRKPSTDPPLDFSEKLFRWTQSNGPVQKEPLRN